MFSTNAVHPIAFPWAEATAATWSAMAALGTLLVALIAAGFAWRQVNEARRLREEQAEPYVAVFLELDYVTSSIDLVVKNFGNTAAFDICISSEPVLERSKDDAGNVEEVKMPAVIKTLVPGQEWRSLLDFSTSRAKTKLPNHYDLTVNFTSQGPVKLARKGERRTKEHAYTYSLDIAALESTQYVVRYNIHNVAKELKKIRDAVEKWREGVGQRGMAVWVRDGHAKDERRRAELAEVRAQREALTSKILSTEPVKVDPTDEHPGDGAQA
ncbi:hypothetical protein [Prauserella endophytica]|uniref:Uncharacterized protein n=1 Tax=Prauserella endophytica TaxID=1592324 RepID=A0ABY2S115_9PSEU|nr:hypothetical protein [Prauserella endophytica]TKG68347.1 hypothetical protein FCN18_21545 [Prauserella endophytica]